MPSNVPGSAAAMSGTRSNGRFGAVRIITLTSAAVKPTSFACTVWSAPRGTLVLPGSDFDAVRARRFGAARDDRGAPTGRGAGRPDRRSTISAAIAATARQRRGMALHRRPLDRAAVVERPALLHRLLDQLLDQPRRMRRRSGRLAVASTALMIAASSVGSHSSRYIATCASVTRRRSGHTSRRTAGRRTRDS